MAANRPSDGPLAPAPDQYVNKRRIRAHFDAIDRWARNCEVAQILSNSRSRLEEYVA